MCYTGIQSINHELVYAKTFGSRTNELRQHQSNTNKEKLKRNKNVSE